MISSKVLTFVLCLICLLMPFAAVGQEHTEKSQARQIDGFYPDQVVSPIIARFDNFAQQLQSEPDSSAYVITYRYYSELPGKSFRTLNWVKKYLMYIDKIPPEKIALVDGGVSHCPVTELWLAPSGTIPKINREYQQVFNDTDSARKYDEYYFDAEVNPDNPYIDIENGYGRASTGSLNAFTATVMKEPQAFAYIIVYPEIGSSASRASKIVRQIRDELIKNSFPLARLKLVNGGYRRLQQIELWILPRGAHPPVATPNAFPKINRRTRKR